MSQVHSFLLYIMYISLCRQRQSLRLALHLATDFVDHHCREDALAASLSSQRVHSTLRHASQPTESIRVLTGR